MVGLAEPPVAPGGRILLLNEFKAEESASVGPKLAPIARQVPLVVGADVLWPIATCLTKLTNNFSPKAAN